MSRARLPDRRLAETLNLQHAGLGHTATGGFYPDGSLGEVFIRKHKPGNASDSTAETIASAISRKSDGSPSGVIGTVLDLIARQP